MTTSKEESYKKEDLVWEAVRRNEYYKSYYSESLKNNLDKRSSKYEGLEKWPIDNYWKLSKLYDPEIHIDEIKKQIKEGANPLDIHPYYDLFNQSETKQVIFHGVFGTKYYYKNKTKPRDFFESSNDKNVLCIKKSEIIDMVTISIDPLVSNKILFEEIKKIKANALKESHNYNVDKNIRLAIMDKEDIKEGECSTTRRNRHIDFKCYTRDIPEFMGLLKKYDELINYCMKKGKENPTALEFKLIKKDGALAVTSNFTFQHMVAKKYAYGSKAYNNQRRIWQSQYEKALELIKSAPNIVFTSAKKSTKRS